VPGHLGAAPPRDEELLGDHVVDERRVGATRDVPAHRRAVLVDQRPELVLRAVVGVGWAITSDVSGPAWL
jgi:hypothetical protein